MNLNIGRQKKKKKGKDIDIWTAWLAEKPHKHLKIIPLNKLGLHIVQVIHGTLYSNWPCARS